MQDISLQLDREPTAELCIEMIECDILQSQAHEELCSFNDSRKFAHKHPLVLSKFKTQSLEHRLRTLQKNNPEKFLEEVSNTQQNIRRIESNIRQKKYKDDATLQSWEDNLKKAREKLLIFTNLIKNES